MVVATVVATVVVTVVATVVVTVVVTVAEIVAATLAETPVARGAPVAGAGAVAASETLEPQRHPEGRDLRRGPPAWVQAVASTATYARIRTFKTAQDFSGDRR